eukprot:3115344-Amphidinium_carterae.1
MPENQKLYRRNQEQKYETIWIGRDTTTGQHITLSPEFGKQLSRTILRLPKDQHYDKTLLLKVTSTEGEYYNSRKKTDKDKQLIPPQLYDLKSPALPQTRTKTTTTAKWHYRRPNQPMFDAPPRLRKFPTFTQKPQMTVQPPPGLSQPVQTIQEPILPTATYYYRGYDRKNNNDSGPTYYTTTTTNSTRNYYEDNTCEERSLGYNRYRSSTPYYQRGPRGEEAIT